MSTLELMLVPFLLILLGAAGWWAIVVLRLLIGDIAQSSFNERRQD
jgi:hypothetical protein